MGEKTTYGSGMTTTGEGPLEAIARRIATTAHEGQTDRAGNPYITHPAFVAAHVDGDTTKAVAWLHDTIEDTDVTAGDLRAAGLPDEVIDAVLAMTHDEGAEYMEYVRRLSENPIARKVKLADLTHNMDVTRLPEFTESDATHQRRYAKAKAYLEAIEAGNAEPGSDPNAAA